MFSILRPSRTIHRKPLLPYKYLHECTQTHTFCPQLQVSFPSFTPLISYATRHCLRNIFPKNLTIRYNADRFRDGASTSTDSLNTGDFTIESMLWRRGGAGTQQPFLWCKFLCVDCTVLYHRITSGVKTRESQGLPPTSVKPLMYTLRYSRCYVDGAESKRDGIPVTSGM